MINREILASVQNTTPVTQIQLQVLTVFIILERITVTKLIRGLVISSTGMVVEVKRNVFDSGGNRNTFAQMGAYIWYLRVMFISEVIYLSDVL